jgi:hypothetical protein
MEVVSLGDAVRTADHSKQPVSPAVALRELYELLEDYAPMWYSEEYHNMARSALGQAAH